MVLGGKNFIPGDQKLNKEEYYAIAKKMDYNQVLYELKSMVMNAESLTNFEADFIKEIARCATRFKEEFRMTKAQQKVWEDLWMRYVLPEILKQKTK